MTKTMALSAGTLKGDKARNPEGKELGHIEELVIDLNSGRVAYAVLASGGFLGVGDKYFAIPWDMLTVDTETKEVVVNVAEDILENAPGFDKDNWPDPSDHAWLSGIYSHYGSDPYWNDLS